MNGGAHSNMQQNIYVMKEDSWKNSKKMCR